MSPLDLLWWSLAIFVASFPIGGGIVIVGMAFVEVRKRWPL